jgi:hypothetical protein
MSEEPKDIGPTYADDPRNEIPLDQLIRGEYKDPLPILEQLAGRPHTNESGDREAADAEIDGEADQAIKGDTESKLQEKLSSIASERVENEQTQAVLAAKVVELTEAAQANTQVDPVLEAEIRRIQDQLYWQKLANDKLELATRREQMLYALNSIQTWAWGRLKEDSKWLFVDLPVHFWKRHKELQSIRDDQKRINSLTGLSGDDLARKNKEDMKAIRNENPQQLLSRWAQQQKTLSAYRRGEPPARLHTVTTRNKGATDNYVRSRTKTLRKALVH